MSNRTSIALVPTLLSLAVVAAGCGPVEAGEAVTDGAVDTVGTAQQAYSTRPDPCLTQAADETLVVPAWPQVADATYSVTSGSGYYAYRTGCTYFIADVEMAKLSHCVFDPNSPDTPLCSGYTGQGAPYDLPSSMWQSYGLGWPTTAEDCDHLTVDYQVYLMPAGSQTFTQQTWVILNGSWNGTTCSATIAKQTGALQPSVMQSTSDTGVDTYRFLVRVKERSSYQEAQAFLITKPPT